MHFSSSALITSLGFLAAVKAIPAPVSNSESADHGISVTLFYTPDGEIESFKNATDLGVDIYGDIPEDFEEKDGEFFAEPGSKAWTWARAQIDIDWQGLSQEKRDLVEKRQSGSANIGIGMWDRDACQGSLRFADPAHYNVAYVSPENRYSVGTWGRQLRNGEQLDFSRYNGGDACGTFVGIYPRNAQPGCYNVSPFVNCFRLWVN